MLFKTRSAAVYGIDAHIIDVEVDFSGIIQENESFATGGLPDTAVRESRDRVRSAIKNSGFDLPPTRITLTSSPPSTNGRRSSGKGEDSYEGRYAALSVGSCC